MSTQNRDDDYVDYEVIGAGSLRISKTCTWKCGGKTGFSLGVEWGQHGFTGGVISKEEAIMMARHIIRTVGLEEVVPD